MAPTPDEFSSPGSASYDSETLVVGDGTWDFRKNTFLLPNLESTNFDTTRYNGKFSDTLGWISTQLTPT